MNKLLLLALLLFSALTGLYSHDIRTAHSTAGLREWHLKNGKHLHAYFLLSRAKEVVLEQKNGQTITVSLEELSGSDRDFISAKNASIKNLNQSLIPHTNRAPEAHKAESGNSTWSYLLRISAIVLLFVLWSLFRRYYRKQGTAQNPGLRTIAGRFLTGKPALLILFTASGYYLFASGRSALRTSSAVTNPAFLDSAFTPFKPSVATRWDSKYFYVESNG
ncbi:MAG: hypothetical protein KJS92_05085, partial [Bacteroidetes bacterium]|nr:hypothetical protein [Bacteroidota bacterium]